MHHLISCLCPAVLATAWPQQVECTKMLASLHPVQYHEIETSGRNGSLPWNNSVHDPHRVHIHSPVHQNVGVADECSGQVNVHLVSGGQTAHPRVIIFLSTAGWKMIHGWVRKPTRNLFSTNRISWTWRSWKGQITRTLKEQNGAKNQKKNEVNNNANRNANENKENKSKQTTI